MRTSNYLLPSVAFVLLAGVLAGAMAQGGLKPSYRSVPEPIEEFVSVSAIEVSDGVMGMDNATGQETAFGYSFLAQTTGAMPGSLTLSMNAVPLTPETQATLLVNKDRQLTGGTWTLPVYKTTMRGGAVFVGSVYGTVANGTMMWDKTGTTGTINFVLNVNGGTQTWAGARGSATFEGIMSVDETTNATIFNGNMEFILLGAIEE